MNQKMPYSRAWRNYRVLRNAYFAIILGLIPFVGLANWSAKELHLSDLVPILLGLAYFVVLILVGWSWVFWPCPRCGRWFRGWRMWPGSSCYYCGLPRNSGGS